MTFRALSPTSNVVGCVCLSVPPSFPFDQKTTDMNHTHARAHQTYEGGYGQTPEGESLGGPTYCAIAALHLVPADHECATQARLRRAEWHATVRWLLHTQAESCGGFAGRTNKLADACYGFWCGASLAVRPFFLSRCVACGTHWLLPGVPNVALRFFVD